MSDAKICDIRQIRELLEMEEQFDDLKRAIPILRPLLERWGTDVESLDEAAEAMEEYKPKQRALATVPDQFNGLFGERGWIMFGDMNSMSRNVR